MIWVVCDGVGLREWGFILVSCERERGSEFGLEFSVILLDSRKSSGVAERGSVGHKGIKKHFF